MSKGFVDPIEYELARERAGALGRLGNRLESGMRRLRELDSAPAAPGHAAHRDALLWELADTVMFLLVAREACGLPSSEYALRYYGVPREVIARVGARPPARPQARTARS